MSKRKFDDDNGCAGGGLSEIDDLFASKKERDTTEKLLEEKAEKLNREGAKRRKQGMREGKRSEKDIRLAYNRSDVERIKSEEWARDELGGIFDTEGFTG